MSPGPCFMAGAGSESVEALAARAAGARRLFVQRAG